MTGTAMPAYRLPAWSSTWIHSASPPHQLKSSSSIRSSSRVQINVQCLSMRGLLLPLQTHWKWVTMKHHGVHGGIKIRNPSPSGSARTSRHRCVPKLSPKETTGIRLEKAPTSPHGKKITLKAPLWQEIGSFQSSEVPALLQPAVAFRHANRKKLLHF